MRGLILLLALLAASPALAGGPELLFLAANDPYNTSTVSSVTAFDGSDSEAVPWTAGGSGSSSGVSASGYGYNSDYCWIMGVASSFDTLTFAVGPTTTGIGYAKFMYHSTDYHGGSFQVSTDNGASWYSVPPSVPWVQCKVPINAGTNTVIFKCTGGSDLMAVYLDDITLP